MGRQPLRLRERGGLVRAERRAAPTRIATFREALAYAAHTKEVTMLTDRSLAALAPLLAFAVLWPASSAQLEPPATHGMLVVGADTIYLSHLPLYVPVHRYQVILEVGFSQDGQDAEQVYRDDLAAPGNERQIYTLDPTEAFVLPNQVLGLTPFKADVYRGHFEDRARRQLILEDVTVEIRRIVHFHQLRSTDRPASPLATTYLLFGTPAELFLAHWIDGPDNYDHILKVNAADVTLAESDLRSGVLVQVTGQLAPNAVARGLLGDFLREGAVPVTLEVGNEVYLEEGELAVPPVFRF